MYADAIPSSLSDDVETYVRFGAHRAGTPQEAATARWFMTRLEALAYAVEQTRFPIRTILSRDDRLPWAT